MKTLKALILVMLAFAGVTAFAQNDGTEDVVYLKNGNIYRGTIIEKNPDVNLKIKTADNVLTVNAGDVLKITREPLYTGGKNEYGFHTGKGYHYKDSTRRQYTFRPRGYFFQSQLLLENLQGGLRIVNGYKFGRFGYLGVGVGFDLTLMSPMQEIGPWSNGNGTQDIAGVYFPLYLYYAGDILKKRITPFYAIEAGYTVSPVGLPSTPFDDGGDGDFNGPRHGPMGLVGFGVKFNTRKRVHFSLLANMNFKYINWQRNYYSYDPNGNYYYVEQSGSTPLVIPGIRFGIGF